MAILAWVSGYHQAKVQVALNIEDIFPFSMIEILKVKHSVLFARMWWAIWFQHCGIFKI
jgi:hypothetical protein